VPEGTTINEKSMEVADLRLEGADLVVRLDGLETLVTLRREARAPITSIRMVHVEPSPMDGLSLWRFPGLCWPSTFAIGSSRRGGRHELAVVHARDAAVVVDLDGTTWDRIIVSHPDAVGIAAQLAAVLLRRGPGGQR